MDYSSAHWSSTISTLLKKTENNLYRHGSQPSLKVVENKSQSKFPDSFYLPSKVQKTADFFESSNEFLQFKNFVFENLKAQSKELQRLSNRLTVKDQLDSEFFEYKENFGMALEAIEKRCLGEIRRFESNLAQFVTFETLKNTEEWLRSDSLEKFSQLEFKFKDTRQAFQSLRDSFSHESEEKLRKLKKKFLKIEDLKKFKENWEQETSGMQSVSVHKFDNLESLVYSTEQNVEQRLEDESKKILTIVEKKTKTLFENLAGFNKKIEEVSEDLLQKLENLKILSEENKSIIEQTIREQNKLKPMQTDLKFMKEQLASLPNFEEFSRKTELTELSKAISDNQQSISISTKQEIKRLSESKPNLLEFAKKNELEELSSALIKKIEMVKLASAGKADIEKLRKTQNDYCSKEEINKLQERLIESEESYELFIEKLQILEKRIKSVEDRNFVENFRKSEEKFSAHGIGNFSELGSKDTQANSLSRNRNEKFEINIKDYIASLCEEFINCEIDFGVKTVKKSRQRPVPVLNFFPQDPPESPDDLNQAVILNTDLTNKSDSPIDFSEIV